MEQVLYYILFIIGFLIILKGSDLFIDSTVWAAEVFRIPQIIIGATIVSICTTLPETFVSVTASLKGETDMAFGNAIGSICVNTGFIMALLIIFTAPKIDDHKSFNYNSIFLICVIVISWFSGYIYNYIGRTTGFLLLFIFLLYIINNVRITRNMIDLDIKYDIEDETLVNEYYNPVNQIPEGVAYDEYENHFDVSKQVIIRNIVSFIIGVGLVIIGSNLLVVNGIHIAELLGVPTIFIALVFTSIGTSLPELVTVITSARKGAVNIGVGNILGANILNIVQVVSLSAIISPIPLGHDKSILFFQVPLTFLIVICAIIFGLINKERLRRWNGFVLIAFYLLFIIVNILRENTYFLGPLLF